MHRIVLALVLVGSSCAHFECKLHGGDEIRSLKTDHFVVTSDLPLDEHRAQSERLELLWDTFAAFFGANVGTAAIPVVVLRSPGAVASFASGYTGFVTRRGPNVLVVGAAAQKDERDTNAHELTHLVSAFMLPRQPRWLAEGLGTLFEDATFKDARTVKMGRWNEGRASEAFQVVLGLDELAEWGGLRFDSDESLYYASAWAWVHYLANHEEAKLKQLFNELRRSKPIPEIMAQLFPPAEAQRLHAAVKQYLADARYRGWETQLRRNPKIEAPVVLEPWEVHLLRSRLFLRDEGDVKKEIEKAIALAPTPMPAKVAVKKAELEEKDPQELLASYPAAPEVLVAAHRRAGLVVDKENLQKALDAAPQDVELLLLAANTAFFAANPELERASELVVRGQVLAPWSPEFAALNAQISVAKKDCAEAELQISQLASLMPERPRESDLKQLKKLRDLVAECGH